MATTTHAKLHLVPRIPAEERSLPARGDVVLLAVLFAINLVPVSGVVLGIGTWGAGTAGFAAACVFLTGRELVSQVRDVLRARR